ncbi:MAG: SsrA-binding protein, partial [Burkholderiales bacterium]
MRRLCRSFRCQTIRRARFDYTIKSTVEAGLVLKGPEVKSLRHGRATLTEAWAGERDGEMWLFNA